MRSLSISIITLALTSIVIANAYYQKKQFYPSVVYITKSNPSMAVIYIQAFICVWICGKIMRRIFFGQLRTTEFEHLMERSWYAITETCLAFTVFRDDFNPKFVALFTLLLFLKSFHWLAEDRVDYMERSPVISLLFHVRVLSLLLLLGSLDLHFIQHAYLSTMSKGASVQLVFGFEYAILITVVINIAIKYALHSVDLNSETPWDNKAVFLLYTELVMGFIKVILYIAFVAIMVRIYTLPLFAFRPMYYTIRNFKKAFSDVILSRRAIHNMNTLYPDATSEELEAADNVCIICREEMTTASKKLPCNHIFHTACLRSWFQRQQTCPTCRLNILRNPFNNNTANPQRQRPVPQNVQNAFANPFFMGQNPFQVFNQQNIENVPVPEPARPPTSSADPNATTQQPQSNVPRFMFPPFRFMPFLPPPMPPPNFATLTPEELQRMEGNERENVEARIQCLRNIQLLLDAAVVMMQQYSTTVAHSAQMPPPTTSATPTTSPSNIFQSSNSTSVPKVAKVAPTTSAAASSSTESPADSGSDKPSTSKAEIPQTSEVVSPEEEIRRRRLQKFEQATAAQNQ
nr:E3 ubiquitin-protein ligase synoviolin A-like [Leptinotarsa decemlineata]